MPVNSGAREPAENRSRQASEARQSMQPPATRGARTNPLLNISISKRLALGFLIPALIAAITLSSVGVQNQQHLLQESSYYQRLFDGYTSLKIGETILQQMHTDLSLTVEYASQPHSSSAIIADRQHQVNTLEVQYNTILNSYLQQDLLARNSDLAALYSEAGHVDQITEQQTYSEGAQDSWRAYRAIQMQVLNSITNGNDARAQLMLVVQEHSAFTDAERSLQSLIGFNTTLVPSLHDVATLDVQKLYIITSLAVLGVLLGIGLVGWLVSSTLIQRLRRLRSSVQAIAGGEVETRLEVKGRDEISEVSVAINRMVDTLVGLLEETKRQRDELAEGEELKHLNASLQREQKALEEANARLEAMATTDLLTGLPNHRALQGILEKECERSRRFGHPYSLLFFDGDRFKRVNDTYGHSIGDVVLRELGERAKSVLRAGDTIGRYGGEEFLVLLPETDGQEARHVAERLRNAVAASPLAMQEVEGGVAVTVSIGLASYPNDGVNASEIQERADQAMYWSKRLGRNQVRTAEEAIRSERDATLKAATAHALERQELMVHDKDSPERLVRIEQLGLVYSLMGVLDVREPGMSEHAHEVGDLVSGMARLLNFEHERVFHASTAAFLHDIGKIALPDQLLQKPREQFSGQEWRLIHQHAELGAEIVEASPWLADLAPAIRHHHERWDGNGTPDGLKGEEIPLEARMITVAEAYHAMISDRPYQARRSVGEVLHEIQQRAGSQFDPALVPVLIQVLENRSEGEGAVWEHSSADLLGQF